MDIFGKYSTRFWTRLFSFLLALLGFTSCDEEEEIAPIYGTLSATFSIKGKVTDNQGKVLEKIQVVIPAREECQCTTSYFIPDQPVIRSEIRDTLYTDSNGEFEWKDTAFPADTVRYELQFHDITSVSNGEALQSDTLKVSFLPGDLRKSKRDNSWYFGHAKKEISVIMKKEKDE